VEYFWSPPSFAHPFDAASTQLSPFEDMTFTVIVTDQYGCADEAEVFVNVLPQPYVDAGPDQHVDFPDAASLSGTAEGETFYWSPPLYIDCTGCLGPAVNPPQGMYYYLTAGGENGCTATDSVWVEIYFPLWVPNTITPNNDGINDYFRAYGENIRGFHLWIIDRWGIELFESEDINAVWDGGINGYYVQNDTYVWIIEYETVERTVRIRGHVNVLR
jgi:gliding motility-associated-like protein